MSEGAACWRATPKGIEIFVRVTPRASREGVEGVIPDADGRERLSVKVRAVPEDGAANRAAAEVLARFFGVPKRTVTLVAGAGARHKTFAIDGPAGHVEAHIAALSRR